MRQFIRGFLALSLLLGLTACSEKSADRQVFAMDTVMGFSAYGRQSDNALKDIESEMHRLEQLLSRTDPNSEISMLNQSDGEQTTVGPEVCQLLETAAQYTAATGGAFDITIAPVATAWGFTTDSFQVPTQTELDKLLNYVGPENVTWSGDTASLTPGTQIDLGGIAKGYASDRVAAIFQEYEITRGKAELGGNVLVLGTRPDGNPWRVGVQDPKRPSNANGFVGILHLTDAYAVTSGGYQRFFEENSKTYHHILDPSTGYPADNGLTSVTVVANSQNGNGTMCDALSTALFVMGEERAVAFWQNSKYDFELVLVTDDDRVIITQGLAGRFAESEESGYTYETVS